MKYIFYILLLLIMGCDDGKRGHDPFDPEKMYVKGDYMEIDKSRYEVHVNGTTFIKNTSSQHWSEFIMMLKREGYQLIKEEIVDGIRNFWLEK